MKLPSKLSRSRSTSPASSTPPSPSTPSPKKQLRFPFPLLGRSSSRKLDPPSQISHELSSSPKPPSSPSSRRTHSHGKAKLMSPSPSHSAHRHGKSKVSETQMQEIHEVFARFDSNGDGKISAEELREVLAALGDETTAEEAVLMVREVDLDGDGYIDLGEFVDLNARCLHGAAEEEEMAAAFAIFDLDKNGRITAEELQAVLHQLGGGVGHRTSVEDCKRMIRGVDRKGTGHVDFDDFKRMMTPLTS